MIIEQVTERLIRSISGGQFTSDGKYDPAYIQSFVPGLREHAIGVSYNGSRTMPANKTISADWQQENIYTIVASEQVAAVDYLVVTALPIVRINSQVDGSVYQGVNTEAYTFLKAQTVTEIAQWKTLKIIGDGRRVGFVRLGDKIRLYGNKQLTTFAENAIYQNPDQVSGWNYNTSRYPINEGLMIIMEELFQPIAVKLGLVAADRIADTVPSSEQGIVKNNLR